MRNLIFMVFFLPMTLLAQKHDYVWHLGTGDHIHDPNDSIWGRSIINFSNHSSSEIKYDGFGYMSFYITNTSISDFSGKFQFSFNGFYLEGSNNDTLPNGFGFNDYNSVETGYGLTQGGLVLPLPESSSKYILIHETHGSCCSPIFIYGYNLYYSIIDMDMNNGLGAVIEKKQLLLQDTLASGKLMATKHANGRDWWMIIPRAESGEYYRFLISPSGIDLIGLEDVGLPRRVGLGQAFFSQDGTKYLTYSGVSDIEGEFLYLYDFDRCSGILSNPMTDTIMNIGTGSSAVFSPSGEIFYVLTTDKIYQYDLTASDIIASKLLVDERDSYLDTVDTGLDTFYTAPSFFMGSIAPDGKIYISSWNNVSVFHTIDYPDVRGVGCQVNQHSVHIPTYNTSIPNFPNYRLGPIDGSICDSLGINNVPLSRFRYEQDTLDAMSFDFIDLSNYEPDTWHWDFGDGTTSQDTSPTHIYAGIGIYPVCLTVSNQYGSHTSCDTLYLGVVANDELATDVDITIYPNPFSDYLILSIHDYYPQNAYIYFYDVMGRFLRKERVRHGTNELDVSDFPKGMVFYEVRDGGVLIDRGKLVRE